MLMMLALWLVKCIQSLGRNLMPAAASIAGRWETKFKQNRADADDARPALGRTLLPAAASNAGRWETKFKQNQS